MITLIDSNVLIDALTEDPIWFDWSSHALASCANLGILAINPIIYAEVSVSFDRIEDLESVLTGDYFKRLPLPWEAAFLAAKCFVEYKKRSGAKMSPLPDFYIGAHAAVQGLRLLTRDARRYRTYFPKLDLITPSGP